jgi:cytochrome c oxidase cbb3-type subunit III
MNRYSGNGFSKKSKATWLLLGLLAAMPGMAQQAAQTDTKVAANTESSTGAVVAIIAVAVLALVIGILAHAVIGARALYEERMKKEKGKTGAGVLTALALLMLSILSALPGHAQQAGAVSQVVFAGPDTIGGMSPTLFYVVVGVIVLELAVIIVLVNMLKFLAGIGKKVAVASADVATVKAPSALAVWWDKLNKSVSIEREKDIDLSHDYDGIRELDNAVPPWWSWSFVAAILFSVVYLWRYHVSETAPLQLQELQIAMQRGEAEKDAYLQRSAKKVDENTVKMMDAGGIAAGQTLFQRNCITCHGNNGEGNNIGPNLTDDYWLHKGGISDIFKSIKYGWVEKGMQSWQGVFSSTEIAQISSYIKSISGTNVPGGKAPQGELYKDEAAAAMSDSATVATPSADTATKK